MRTTPGSLWQRVSLGVVAAGCEDNTAPAPAGFGPPTNVLAQSVNASSVGLSWGPPAGVADTMLAAYIISYGDVRDSVPGSPRVYTAANLPQGITSFTLQAVSMDKQYSNTAGKSWAPAARYDSVFSLYEYDVSQLLRNSALNIGTPDRSALRGPRGACGAAPVRRVRAGSGRTAAQPEGRPDVQHGV